MGSKPPPVGSNKPDAAPDPSTPKRPACITRSRPFDSGVDHFDDLRLRRTRVEKNAERIENAAAASSPYLTLDFLMKANRSNKESPRDRASPKPTPALKIQTVS